MDSIVALSNPRGDLWPVRGERSDSDKEEYIHSFDHNAPYFFGEFITVPGSDLLQVIKQRCGFFQPYIPKRLRLNVRRKSGFKSA